MKKYFFLLFLFVSKLPAQPTIQWQKCLGGNGADEAYAIQQTSDGGYIVAGPSPSNSGDVFGNNGGLDFWIVKLDSMGQITWKKTYGGSTDEQAYSIRQALDGGYILTGYTLSTDKDVSGNHGYYDAWVLKLDSLGTIQWQRCLGGSDWEEGNDAQPTKDGGYIVVGRSRSTDGDVTVNHGTLDYWIVKLDSLGTIEWQKSYGGSKEDIAYCVSQTLDGGYIVAGESSSIDGDVIGNHGGADYWILKLNFEGKIEWKKSIGGSSFERANDILQARNGGYVVLGQAYSNNGDVTGNHGYGDFWVVKLNETGEILWQKAIGGSAAEYARSIYQTADGGYVMSGQTQSTNGDVVGNDGGADLWVVKINGEGEIQWQKAMGGTQDEWGNSIQQTSDLGYIVAGYTRSNNGDVSGQHGSIDFWVVKLSPESTPTTTPQSTPLEVYPNPAQNTITLKLPSGGGSIAAGQAHNTLSISITDLLGRELSRQLPVNTAQSSAEVDISILPNGFYLLTATLPSGQVFFGKIQKLE